MNKNLEAQIKQLRDNDIAVGDTVYAEYNDGVQSAVVTKIVLNYRILYLLHRGEDYKDSHFSRRYILNSKSELERYFKHNPDVKLLEGLE